MSRSDVNSYLNNAYVVFYEATHISFDDIRPAIDPSKFRDLEQLSNVKSKDGKEKRSNCPIS